KPENSSALIPTFHFPGGSILGRVLISSFSCLELTAHFVSRYNKPLEAAMSLVTLKHSDSSREDAVDRNEGSLAVTPHHALQATVGRTQPLTETADDIKKKIDNVPKL